MPLMILGLVFVVGLFIFYLASTQGGRDKSQKQQKKDSGLQRDENVIFLPNDVERAKERHRKNRR
ncbi:hypothetical protein ACDL92_05020 [Ihubacter sp. mB4P-1]|uniref:hypothetical protein n=1 Tax=Ihubacter sp. mB4P-1 TaxID=3242370 RepID=UPI0013798C0B